MRKIVIGLFAAAVVLMPGTALATPVNFGTLITLGGTGVTDAVQSQFTQASDHASADSISLDLFGAVDLSLGKVRASSVHPGTGAVNSGQNVILYDTLTFATSAFQGAFGTSYDLPLNVHFEGTFTGSGSFPDSGAGGGINVLAGSTVVDSSNFADGNTFINFLYLSGLTPLCSNGLGAPDFNTLSGAFSFDVSCVAHVDAAHPSIRIFVNLGIAFNLPGGGSSWNLDMTHSATLSADFGGREVTSGSGVFPGITADAAVPEPATLTLAGLGLALVALRARRNARG